MWLFKLFIKRVNIIDFFLFVLIITLKQMSIEIQSFQRRKVAQYCGKRTGVRFDSVMLQAKLASIQLSARPGPRFLSSEAAVTSSSEPQLLLLLLQNHPRPLTAAHLLPLLLLMTCLPPFFFFLVARYTSLRGFLCIPYNLHVNPMRQARLFLFSEEESEVQGDQGK